jgi:hypothetical protein
LEYKFRISGPELILKIFADPGIATNGLNSTRRLISSPSEIVTKHLTWLMR